STHGRQTKGSSPLTGPQDPAPRETGKRPISTRRRGTLLLRGGEARRVTVAGGRGAGWAASRRAAASRRSPPGIRLWRREPGRARNVRRRPTSVPGRRGWGGRGGGGG